MGFVGSAIEHLKRGAYVRHSQDRRMCGYASNREGFWRDITQLRDDLKKAGL